MMKIRFSHIQFHATGNALHHNELFCVTTTHGLKALVHPHCTFPSEIMHVNKNKFTNGLRLNEGSGLNLVGARCLVFGRAHRDSTVGFLLLQGFNVGLAVECFNVES